jgi:hypothetical protein
VQPDHERDVVPPQHVEHGSGRAKEMWRVSNSGSGFSDVAKHSELAPEWLVGEVKLPRVRLATWS